MEEKVTAAPQVRRVRRKGNTGKWIMLIFSIIFVMVIVVSWIATNQDRAKSHSSDHIPQNLGQLELVGQITGENARAEIGKLHGKGIEMVDGYIAEYSHNQSRVTVWVAEASSEIGASGLLKQMVDRIGAGNQAFRNLRAISVGGREVYTADGKGGDHYFYSSDNKVIWLAIQGAEPIGIVKAALKTF
mgnify:CR=1 FL=1